MIHRGEKGFTLIELLVVIAILGVIAAVVALSVAGFFGRGTLQAANTELHQAQTAIIAAMADAETSIVDADDNVDTIWWVGESETIQILDTDGVTLHDAAAYLYGPFRAAYEVEVATGAIVAGLCSGDSGDLPQNPWGPTIWFCTHYTSWVDEACGKADCDNCNNNG